MLRKLSLLVAVSLIGISSANAATLFLPGNSGIPDAFFGGNGCIPEASSGTMRIFPPPGSVNNDCLMSYSINLPTGSTIDGVEIAYRDDSNGAGRNIAAYLAKHVINPFDTYSVAVAGANDFIVSPESQSLFMNMGSLSVPVGTGAIYWVQVSTHRITQVQYVSVKYH